MQTRRAAVSEKAGSLGVCADSDIRRLGRSGRRRRCLRPVDPSSRIRVASESESAQYHSSREVCDAVVTLLQVGRGLLHSRCREAGRRRLPDSKTESPISLRQPECISKVVGTYIYRIWRVWTCHYSAYGKRLTYKFSYSAYCFAYYFTFSTNNQQNAKYGRSMFCKLPCSHIVIFLAFFVHILHIILHILHIK